jgi:putative transposase
MPDEKTRVRLIELVCRLPLDKLAELEQFLVPLASEGTPRPTLPAQAAQTPAKCWPHAPQHCLSEHGTFLVTAGTLHKQHLFHTVRRLDLLEEQLLKLAAQYRWRLEAWAVFSNHYHFVGHSQPESGKLNEFLNHLHGETARHVNAWDNAADRQVWHNFWETRLTYERSYLARLNYVHQNPVRHGLVRVANQYRWCSAGWLERTATPAQVKTVYCFKIDKLKVLDDFEVLAPVA